MEKIGNLLKRMDGFQITESKVQIPKFKILSNLTGRTVLDIWYLNFGFVSNFDIRILDFKWLIHSPQMDHVKLPKLETKLLKQRTRWN